MGRHDTIIDTPHDGANVDTHVDEVTDDSISVDSPELRQLSFDERYETKRRLGEGGMGEVTLFKDRQIGRKVALKVLRSSIAHKAEARDRFLREARIQGQLEHPAVVPVYDLGVTPSGDFYFTMKRVQGMTLGEMMEYRHDHTDPDGRFSPRRLMRAFSSVCLAVDYAHKHGVIHRDLKPGNVMLGDFGEVYVLDWGLARVLTDTSSTIDLQDEHRKHTVLGTVLGTPGYMSPEQMRGEHDLLTPASDIYSLGAILFELLTERRLDPRRTASEQIASWTGRSSKELVPKELVTIIDRATAKLPEDRYRSARALAYDLDFYLDGARDDARRREQAARHAERAAVRAREAQSGGPDSQQRRREALREVGKSMALDPENQVAVRTLVSLLSEPPETLPPELEVTVREQSDEQTQHLGKIGTFGYGVLPAYLPFLLWLGIRDPIPIVVFFVLGTLSVLSSLATWRGWLPTKAGMVITLGMSNLCFASTAAFWGPLVVTPMLLTMNTAAYALHMDRGYRIGAVVFGCTLLVATVVLGLIGWLPGGYVFDGDSMTIEAGAVGLPAVGTYVVFTMASVMALVILAIAVSSVRAALGVAERRHQLYAWHMRELVSSSPGLSVTATSPGQKIKRP